MTVYDALTLPFDSIWQSILKNCTDEKGAPTKCFFCGSISFHFRVIDSIGYTTTEQECFCSSCNKSIGYWAYGYWQRY